MIQAVKTRCPLCTELKYSLSFMLQIGAKSFHICDTCLEQERQDKVTKEGYLLIGYEHGFYEAMEKVRDFTHAGI